LNILIFQLDGKIPNIACMRIAAHHKACGDSVSFRWTGTPDRELWDKPDRVYGSALFTKTLPAVQRLRCAYPDAIIGGTGVGLDNSLEQVGIKTKEQDYSLYPKWRQSIGYTQRGCRLNCWFCVVRKKEGKVQPESSIYQIWRGEPWPKELQLLDNDFFGQEGWPEHIKDIREGGFKVCFNQGINARLVSDEQAEALASVNYRDDQFKRKRLYFAWDNIGDEAVLFRGLRRLQNAGIKPDDIMVYMLIGADHSSKSGRASLTPDDFERHKKLRDFGCRPYPMPYVRTPETMGFQRWIIGAYDKRISWEDWKAAKYQPSNLTCEPK
jgi:hypothetical protein